MYLLGSNSLKLEDPNRKLSSYSGLTNGSTVMIVMLQPFILYVTGLDGAMQEIEVPSSDPQVNMNFTSTGDINKVCFIFIKNFWRI